MEPMEKISSFLDEVWVLSKFTWYVYMQILSENNSKESFEKLPQPI